MVVVCSTVRAGDSTTVHGAYSAHGIAPALSVGSCSCPVGPAVTALAGLLALTSLQAVPVVTTEEPSSGTNSHSPAASAATVSAGTHCTTLVADHGVSRRGAAAHE
jgi:hypothetical protein